MAASQWLLLLCLAGIATADYQCYVCTDGTFTKMTAEEGTECATFYITLGGKTLLESNILPKDCCSDDSSSDCKHTLSSFADVKDIACCTTDLCNPAASIVPSVGLLLLAAVVLLRAHQ